MANSKEMTEFRKNKNSMYRKTALQLKMLGNFESNNVYLKDADNYKIKTVSGEIIKNWTKLISDSVEKCTDYYACKIKISDNRSGLTTASIYFISKNMKDNYDIIKTSNAGINMRGLKIKFKTDYRYVDFDNPSISYKDYGIISKSLKNMSLNSLLKYIYNYNYILNNDRIVKNKVIYLKNLNIVKPIVDEFTKQTDFDITEFNNYDVKDVKLYSNNDISCYILYEIENFKILSNKYILRYNYNREIITYDTDEAIRISNDMFNTHNKIQQKKLDTSKKIIKLNEQIDKIKNELDEYVDLEIGKFSN